MRSRPEGRTRSRSEGCMEGRRGGCMVGPSHGRATKRLLLRVLVGFALIAAVLSAQEPPEPKGLQEAREMWKWANFAILAIALGYAIGKYAPGMFRTRTAEIQKGIAEAQQVKRDCRKTRRGNGRTHEPVGRGYRGFPQPRQGGYGSGRRATAAGNRGADRENPAAGGARNRDGGAKPPGASCGNTRPTWRSIWPGSASSRRWGPGGTGGGSRFNRRFREGPGKPGGAAIRGREISMLSALATRYGRALVDVVTGADALGLGVEPARVLKELALH